jgi:hypothetical protein
MGAETEAVPGIYDEKLLEVRDVTLGELFKRKMITYLLGVWQRIRE